MPDGPLHPADLVWALGTGLVLGAAIRRNLWIWIPVVVLCALGLLELRYPGVVADGFFERPNPLWPMLGIGSWTMAGWALLGRARVDSRTFVTLILAATVLTWAIVPDTEAPLVLGGFLAGVAIWTPRGRMETVGALLILLPASAAVIGSVGRPGRLVPALVGSVSTMVLGLAVAALAQHHLTRRAGTPTTVVPASTSSVTTAPAATTAP